MTAVRGLGDALVRGYERLAAWADLLDRINVFPVADADTGTNLKISLAPVRHPEASPTIMRERLLQAATGNSGNIGCAFLSELITVRKPVDLLQRVPVARDRARQAVADPRPGTMLTLFDALADAIDRDGWQPTSPDARALIEPMQAAVAGTTAMLPDLEQAGVVDAGALGMFIFLEACFTGLFPTNGALRPVTEIFPCGLRIQADWRAGRPDGDYCINTTLDTTADAETVKRSLDGIGNSVVVGGDADQLRIHAHTRDRRRFKERLAGLGTIDRWAEEAMAPATNVQAVAGPVHVMTDAAGTLTFDDARQLGVTLLDSYLTIEERIVPETLLDPADLYAAMAAGIRVTTAQASVFERHQTYLNAARSHNATLYLCVGSVYTGNYDVAVRWQAEHDPDGRLTILDSGAASGRLGIAAMATARFARTAKSAAAVKRFAERAMAVSRELVFLNTLKYLAAGGRISRTKGFFGDLLHLKPVVSPQPEGAANVGMVRNRRDQVAFALNHLEQDLADTDAPMILVQYTDNRPWVEATVVPAIAAGHPTAEILLRPLSLTSGAHMGPGTWAVAYLDKRSVRQETA